MYHIYGTLHTAQAEEEELKSEVAAVEDELAAAAVRMERLSSVLSRQEAQAAASSRFQRAQDWYSPTPSAAGSRVYTLNPAP